MSSPANGRASGQKISKVLWTLPHFLLVTHVHTRVHPEAWGARMCRQHSGEQPSGDAVWRICDSTVHGVLVWARTCRAAPPNV